MIKKLRTCVYSRYALGAAQSGQWVPGWPRILDKGQDAMDTESRQRSNGKDAKAAKASSDHYWSSSNSFDEKNEFDTNLTRPPALAMESSVCGAEIELNSPV